MRWGMVIDLKRCIGCYGCQLACKAEHGTPPGVFYARVLKREEGTYPTAQQLFLPALPAEKKTFLIAIFQINSYHKKFEARIHKSLGPISHKAINHEKRHSSQLPESFRALRLRQ